MGSLVAISSPHEPQTHPSPHTPSAVLPARLTWSDPHFDDICSGKDQLFYHLSCHHIPCLRERTQHVVMNSCWYGVRNSTPGHKDEHVPPEATRQPGSQNKTKTGGERKYGSNRSTEFAAWRLHLDKVQNSTILALQDCRPSRSELFEYFSNVQNKILQRTQVHNISVATLSQLIQILTVRHKMGHGL